MVKGLKNESELFLQKILRLLQHLLLTPDGSALYSRIKKGKALSDSYNENIQKTFIAYIDAQLKQYTDHNKDDVTTHIVAGLVKRRLAPFLAAKKENKSGMSGKNKTRFETEALEDHLVSVLMQVTPSAEPAQDSVDISKRPDLRAKRQKLEESQNAMQETMALASDTHIDLLSNLQTIRYALESADGNDHTSDLRDILVCAIDETIEWQQGLASQLNESARQLNEVRLDNIKLHEEIEKVRQLTLTDESTGLPNRQAFLQQLHAELGRALRHETALSICLLAVDDDGNGTAMSTQVLQGYIDRVISQFRGYDLVARVAINQFALMLPNTDIEGAVRALTEAQNRSRIEQKAGPELPSFSVGIAVARENESADELMQRASQALVQASHDGRRMLEISGVEIPAQSSAQVTPQRLH